MLKLVNQTTSQSSSTSSIDLKTAKFFVWTYVIPVLCLVGLFTNAICVVVFSQRKTLKNSIYRYFLLHSVIDLVYLALIFIRFVIKTSLFSGIHSSYWTKVFEAYIHTCITSSLAILMILLELIVAFKRLLIIMNLNLTFKLKFRTIISICAFIGFVAFVPLAASLRIVDQRFCNYTIENIRCSSSGSRPSYALTQENVPYLPILKRLYIGVFVFRGLVAPALLLILNLAIARKFWKLCKRKRNLKASYRLSSTKGESSVLCDSLTNAPNQSKPIQMANFFDPNASMTQAKRNLTLMIITINVVFIISNLSACLSYLTFLVFKLSSVTSTLIFIGTNITLFLTHGCGLFIYLCFDRQFRQAFNGYFSNLFRIR